MSDKAVADDAQEASEGVYTEIAARSSGRHFAADSAIPMFLGRDFEIAFILNSPLIKQTLHQQEPSRLNVSYEPKPHSEEVVRVRFSPDSAVALAMMILASAVHDGRIDPSAVTSAVAEMVSGAGLREDGAQ